MSSPLRVVCSGNNPPFVDITQGECVGLFADAFTTAIQNLGLAYELTVLTNLSSLAANRPLCGPELQNSIGCIENSEDAASIIFNTNSSAFDVAIVFASVATDQMEYVEMTVPLTDVYYAALLRTSDDKANGIALLYVIFSSAVLHLIGVVFLITLGASLAYLIFENFIHSSYILTVRAYSMRLAVCFMVALSNVLGLGTVVELAHPVSNAVRTAVSYASIFVISTFGALICSGLTANSMAPPPPTLRSLAGARIAVDSAAARDFLLSSKANAAAVLYASLGPAVAAFYGANPDRLDGFAAQPETVDYYLSVHAAAAAAQPYGITAPFAPSGSPDPRGLFLSKVSASESAPAPPTAALRLNFWA